MYNSIIIAGPTGVGKTSLSIKLAKRLNAEIISCDASQVYRHLDIGTAKISEDEKEGVVHHLIDIKEPYETYSVGQYYTDCNEILNSSDKCYLLVGGTGLYIQAITDGLTKMPEIDIEKRKYLESLDLDVLVSMLDDKENIDLKNKRRVIRRIETSNIKHENIIGNNRKFLKIFLNRDRENLYNRINKRVDKMIEDGLLKEARDIFEKYNVDISSIGYKELFMYFKNQISQDEAIEKIKTASRRYAKRQLTWFKNKDYIIYNLDDEDENEIIEKIIKEYNNG